MTRRTRRQAARPSGVVVPQAANSPAADSPTASIATDVLHAVFDSLPLTDVVSASGVCRQWRVSARSHSTFWRCVSLLSGTSAAVELFLARIDYHATAPLHIHIESVQTNAKLAHRILAGISKQMGRVDVLQIDTQAFSKTPTLRTALGRVLSKAAPRLQKFQLADYTDTNFLPSDLFSDSSPCLSEVTMFGVYDLSAPMPAAVTRVSTCTVGSCRPLHSPEEFLRQFSQLKKLSLSAQNVCHGAIAPDLTFANLQELDLDLVYEPGSEEFLASPAIATIPRIELMTLFSSPPPNAKFFQTLGSGALHVSVHRPPGEESFSFVVWNEHYNVKRAIKEIPFEQLPSRFLPPKTPFFDRDALCRRITTITIPLDMIDMIGRWFGEHFPALETVFVDMLPPKVPFRGGWCAPKLDIALLEGGPGRLTQFSYEDIDFLGLSVLGINNGDEFRHCFEFEDIEPGGAVDYADPDEYDNYIASMDMGIYDFY